MQTREEKNVGCRRRYKQNRVLILRRLRIKRLKNLEEFREYERENKKKHLSSARKYRNKRYAEDPEFRIRLLLGARISSAIRAVGAVKRVKSLSLLGCSLPELRKYLSSLFKSGMTWENYGPVWHVDHIKPCAGFDLSDLEQQKTCFHWTNLQPLFARENFMKGDR